MRMQAGSFEVILRIFTAGDGVAVRFANFEEVEEVHDFLQVMVNVLNPDDEIEVTCDIQYETLTGEARFMIEVPFMKCTGQFLQSHLEDL